MVLLVIGCASAFGWLMAFLQVPQATIAAMRAVSDNPIVILLLINVILLVLGTFMDMAPMIIICTPIFLPVVKAFGIDPVHFGIMLILNAGIGLNTPPVGSVLFVGCAVGKISIGEAMKTIWPFLGASVCVLLLVTYIPGAVALAAEPVSGEPPRHSAGDFHDHRRPAGQPPRSRQPFRHGRSCAATS